MQMLKSSEQQPNLTSEPQVPEKPFSQTPGVTPDEKGCTTLSCGLHHLKQNKITFTRICGKKVKSVIFFLPASYNIYRKQTQFIALWYSLSKSSGM